MLKEDFADKATWPAATDKRKEELDAIGQRFFNDLHEHGATITEAIMMADRVWSYAMEMVDIITKAHEETAAAKVVRVSGLVSALKEAGRLEPEMENAVAHLLLRLDPTLAEEAG